ncbi:MAG: choice-of-anchor D domain-containing protein [Candidatus Kapaibacterium sp.]
MNLTLRYCLLFLLLSFSTGLAQENSLTLLNIETADYPLLRAHFYLSDSSGAILRDVFPSDLIVEENGQQREVRSLTCPPQKLPERLSSVLAIDISGSMMNDRNMEIARAAANAWIDALPLGYSECAVVSFNHLSYLNQDFTIDREQLKKAIALLTPTGGTEYDAGFIDPASGSLPVASAGEHKKVIVFLTDGLSKGKEEVIVRQAEEAGATIYTIVLRMAAPNVLKNIAERTGGAWFEGVESREEAEMIYQTILHHAQGDEPCEVEWVGESSCETFHSITLSIPFYNVEWSGGYRLPDTLLPLLRSTPSTVSFGLLTPGESRDTLIRIFAEGKPVEITGVEISDPHFTLTSVSKPFPVRLQPGEGLEVSFRFTPDDSVFRFAHVAVQSSGCDSEVITLTGGWPGIRSPEQELKLISPNGGEVYAVGEDVLIEWEGTLPEDTVLLEYSLDGGDRWQRITDTATGLFYRWSAPAMPSNRCLMRVRQLTANGEGGVIVIPANQVLTTGTFDANGTSVLFAGNGTDIGVFSLLDSSSYTRSTLSFRGYIGLEFSPDGKILLISSGDIDSYLYDWEGDKLIRLIGGSSGILSLSTFNPDGTKMVSHAYTDDVLMFDVGTGRLLQQMKGHTYRGFAIDWSPDGKWIVSGSYEALTNRQGILWDAATGRLVDSLPHPDQVNSVAFSPDSRRIVTACHDSILRIWDVATGELLTSVREAARVADAEFSPDGNLIAVALLNGGAVIRDGKSGEFVRQLVGHRREVRHIEHSRDGSHILTVSSDSTARVWDLTRLPNQVDSSDFFWSIVEPRLNFLPVDMGRVGYGSYKDSTVVGWLCNNGSVPVTIDSITFAGTGYFSLVSGVPPYKLSPGECSPAEFRFTPGRIGSFTDSVIIHPGTARSVTSITGEGIIAPLRVNIPTIDFGEVILHTEKDSVVTAVVTNVGSIPLWIEKTELSGPDTEQFSILSGGEAFALNPGEFRTMSLRFKPERKGRTTGSLLFHYDGAGNFFFGLPPAQVNLTGEGICPDVIEGNQLFLPENLGATAGDEILIPVLIESTDSLPERTEREYRILLRFNKTVLAPVDLPELDLSDTDERYLQFRGTWSGRGDTVALLRFVAALGNSPSTPIVVEAFTMDDGCYGGFSRKDGSFLLSDLCEDGGTRLFILNDSLYLKPVRPNPARGEAEIRFSLVEDGETDLFVLDPTGKRIATLTSEFLVSGEYVQNLPTGELPSGNYVVVLKTKTRIISRSFQIVQ